MLEGRCVPAIIYWDGGGDGSSWGDALNWGGDMVPGAPDRAMIETGGFTVIGGNAVVGSLHCNANFDWTGFLSLVGGPSSEINGYFTLHSGNVTISGQDLNLRGGGNLQGTFDASADSLLSFGIGGTFLLQAGTVLGGAGYTHLAGSTLDLLGAVDAGNFHLSAGYLQGVGKFTVGNLHWSGGTMRGLGITEVPLTGTLHLGDGPRGTGSPSVGSGPPL